MIRSGKTKPIFHAKSRPPETEAKAIRRCIKIAQETGGRLFIVHMASDEGMDAVSTAQENGLEVFAETCTHYLAFTEAQLEREDGIKWICSPPLRSKAIQRRLWEGVANGAISMVSSDDAAFSWKAKLLGAGRFDKCPNGIPGIEPRMTLLYSEAVARGLISLPKFVELVSTAPAQLFGLTPRKGNLSPEADADIVLFDPSTKWTMGQATLHMASDWSAYEDIPITGKILKVLSRGELIVDGEDCLAGRGRGRYLHRKLKQPA
jgi:dihydropyrimidinase